MLRPGRRIGPQHVFRVLVDREEAGRLRRGDVVVLDIHAVRRANEKHVARAGDRAIGHVVLRYAHLLHHVEVPNDVGFVLVGVFFLLVGAVVLAVVETFGVEAANFAATGDEPQPVAFDERRTADALQRPIVNAAGRQLLAAMLPEEFAVLRVEAQQAA